MEPEQKYYRCRECSYVYLKKEVNCPNCNSPQIINEDNNGEEDVFNLCD